VCFVLVCFVARGGVSDHRLLRPLLRACGSGCRSTVVGIGGIHHSGDARRFKILVDGFMHSVIGTITLGKTRMRTLLSAI
jgi:hypothetical protein